MFIRTLQANAECHSERSEESLILSEPIAHKNKPRCFASLNMTLAVDGFGNGHSGISLPLVDQQRFFFFELACVAEFEPTTVAVMKPSTKIFAVACALLFSVTLGIVAGTPEQEKAFTDKYKTALKGADTITLESVLYTQGSDPAALEFYKMMLSGGAGEKI